MLSVLDLVPVSAGRTRAEALGELLALARCADGAGYARYWLAEHHGSTTYLSAATTTLMGQVLAATNRIGVSSGGIMLPNHAPLVIAEQIGTLATFYPGRVGLGLGRAPGTDPMTAAALRRRTADPARFAEEILETLAYLGAIPDDALSAVPGSLVPPVPGAPDTAGPDAAAGRSVGGVPMVDDGGAAAPAGSGAAVRRVRAVPGEGTAPDVWVLGSSINGARVAGTLGLPFAVASHFAPGQAEAAITAYRSLFLEAQESGPRADAGRAEGSSRPHLSADGRPRVAAGVNVVVAPTREEAVHLFSTAMAAAARVVGGRPGPLDEPTGDPRAWRDLAGGRQGVVEASMALSFVGTPEEVAAGLRELAARWGLDELLVVTLVHDAAARRRSYELLARAW